MEENLIKKSKKIVIKIGSSTLTDKDGRIDKDFIKSFVSQVEKLIKEDKQVIIVSSGARIAGVSTIDKWSRKEDVNYKQALCAIGQVELMDSYRVEFDNHNIHVAQILLTNEDFKSETRRLNIRNTIFTLLDERVVPIVNENDTVCVDEIKIGDNDMLAAQATVLWNADLLILLSEMDGVYDKNPAEYSDAKLIEKVYDIDQLEKNIKIGKGSDFGTGGVATKLEAARMVNSYGIDMMVANGKAEGIIDLLKEDKKKATTFYCKDF